MKPMSQREISLGVEKKLMENISATVRLVQKHLRYAVEDVGIISGEDVLWYLANPGYGYSRSTTDGGKFDANIREVPKAKREYWGLNFSLEQKIIRPMAGRVLLYLEPAYGQLFRPRELGRIFYNWRGQE